MSQNNLVTKWTENWNLKMLTFVCRDFWFIISSRGTISKLDCYLFFYTNTILPIRKSNISHRLTAMAISLFCTVLRLFSCVWIHDLRVSSSMISSAAFANKIGASALIIYKHFIRLLRRWLFTLLKIVNIYFALMIRLILIHVSNCGGHKSLVLNLKQIEIFMKLLQNSVFKQKCWIKLTI